MAEAGNANYLFPIVTMLIQIFFPPFLIVLGITILLACFGKSLGIRKLYVKVLIKIFDFSRKIATEAQHHKIRQQSAEINVRKSSYHVQSESNTSSDEDETRQKVPEKNLNSQLKIGHCNINDNQIGSGAEVGYDASTGSKLHQLHLMDPEAVKLPKTLENTEIDEEHDHDVAITAENSAGEKYRLDRNVSVKSFQREFKLDDVFPYIKSGIASIIEDEVTQRFVAEELKSWNLLTRTSQSFEFVNIRLTVIWIIGFLFRYCVLLPGRILILGVGILWLSICMAFVGNLPDSETKKALHYYVYTSCFQIIGGSLSAVITYHNMANKPKRGICVANHTSPIDVLILACDNAYALIGQMHGGFLGQFQKTLSKCSDHIWFERSDSKDRSLITKRLREHVEDPDKLPILIFPEGTCINNTSVMQFKKGSFEVGGTIYPVAIKYNPLFGDAFWNSSKHGMLTHIYLIMTSWAIVCDVWYLRPMTRNPDEDAVTFANRVKAEIARQGGLVDLMWDGNLKRSQVKSEWKGKQQQEFAERIKLD